MSDPRTQFGQDLTVDQDLTETGTGPGPGGEPHGPETQPIWTGAQRVAAELDEPPAAQPHTTPSIYPTWEADYPEADYQDADYPDAERPERSDVASRPPTERMAFAGWFGATLALLCTVGLATLIGWLPYLPVGDTRGWAVVYNLLDVEGPRTVATWWGTVLAVLVAMWSWAAAGRARRSHAWLRWVAWALVGLTGLLYSASHLMALHQTTRDLPFVRELGLPALVSEHPVEFALTALLTVPVVVLLVSGRSSQRVLLLLGALLFAVGALLIGSGRWVVTDQGHHQLLAEVVCEWLAMVCVLFAAVREKLLRPWHDPQG
jgi:hypothetical protein